VACLGHDPDLVVVDIGCFGAAGRASASRLGRWVSEEAPRRGPR
jgi:hypothetical protein